MNFKYYANQLEQVLHDEFQKNVPMAVLKNKVIVYKRFKIVPTGDKSWNLLRMNGDFVNNFKFKSTALLAAKYYDNALIIQYNQIKLLDTKYWYSVNDLSFFKFRYNNALTADQRDIFKSRLDVTATTVTQTKTEIFKLFNAAFI